MIAFAHKPADFWYRCLPCNRAQAKFFGQFLQFHNISSAFNHG